MQSHLRETYFGELAEWSNAAVLKTVDLNGSGGSNPSLSAEKGVTDICSAFFNFSSPKVPQKSQENLGVIAGPCHAEEIALERLSYLTVGCKDQAKALEWQKLFTTPYVHTTPSNDVEGLEYASVMKNIYAIAAGICKSLHYGDNFQAVLLTNAMHEMIRFTKAKADIERDITDSGYLGDVLVTAYSNFSRNRQFGQMIGMGYSVKAAQTEMEMVAEGYYGTQAIWLANQDVQADLPIVEAVYQILYNRRSAKAVIKELTKKFQ